MCKVSLGHEVVRLDDLCDVTTVNTDGNSHDHVLWPLNDLAVDAEKVRPFERLEAKVIVRKVAIVDDRGIQDVFVVHDDLVHIIGDHRRGLVGLWIDPAVQIGDDSGKALLRLLVEIRDCDSCGKDGVIGMLGREVRGGLSGKVLFVSKAQ